MNKEGRKTKQWEAVTDQSDEFVIELYGSCARVPVWVCNVDASRVLRTSLSLSVYTRLKHRAHLHIHLRSIYSLYRRIFSRYLTTLVMHNFCYITTSTFRSSSLTWLHNLQIFSTHLSFNINSHFFNSYYLSAVWRIWSLLLVRNFPCNYKEVCCRPIHTHLVYVVVSVNR